MLSEIRPRWFYAALGFVVAGSAADLGLTLWGLRLGAIWEGNPLIATAIAWSPLLAAALKLGVTCGAAWVLHWAYPRRPALVGAGLGVVAVSTLWVLGLHLGWLLRA